MRRDVEYAGPAIGGPHNGKYITSRTPWYRVPIMPASPMLSAPNYPAPLGLPTQDLVKSPVIEVVEYRWSRGVWRC